MTPSALCRAVAAVVIASAASLACAPAHALACGCADVADIRNRLCVARMAISEYERLTTRTRRLEDQMDRQLPYSAEAKDSLVKPCVQEAVNTVHASGSKVAVAETSDETCEVTVTRADSACMRESILRHENRHAAICMWRQERREERGMFAELIARVSDPARAGQTLTGYMAEERSAYQSEINHLRSELTRLSLQCPRDMFLVNQGGRMVFSLEWCPRPRPRPAKQDSQCGERD